MLDGARLLLIPSYGARDRRQNQTVLARARENGVPIVEANVGMNLIISKGEVVAYKWGVDRITTADIEVPALPSTEGCQIAGRPVHAAGDGRRWRNATKRHASG